MTIEVVAFILIGAYIATVFVWVMWVMPLQSSRSRLIGKLNQKEWQIAEWQQAYEKANNDFMKLAEIQQTLYDAATTFKEQTKGDGWVEWEYSEATPHPLTLDTRVDVKFGDGSVFINDTVKWWYSDEGCNANCWKPNGKISELIVAYRLTKETYIK